VIGSQEQGTRRRGRQASSTTRSGPPRRAPELGHLSLDELRAYRQELVTEESRVSYWRRILQARMDLVLSEDRVAMARLRHVLGEHAAESQRLALLRIDSPEGTPPLPDLAILWQIPIEGFTAEAANEEGSDAGVGPAPSALTRLADAEHQLSAYRRSLHQRSLALTALPLGG
jgi:hypothetical protein